MEGLRPNSRPGRHRADGRVRIPEVDPLFGSGIRMSAGWAQHDGAGADLGFWTLLWRLPRLMRISFGLAWQAGHWLLPVAVAAKLFAGAATGAVLLATNAALALLLAGTPTVERLIEALPILLAVAAGGVARSVLSSVGDAANGKLAPRIDRAATVKLLERAVRVELVIIKNAEFRNLMSAAARGALSARMVTTYAIALVEALTGLIAAAGVLTVLHPVLMPLMVVVTVPSAWGAVRMARARFSSMKRWTELQRQLETLSELLIDSSPAEEVRAHRAGGFLLHHYERLARLSEAEQARLAGLEARTTLVSDGVAGIARLAMYGMLGTLLVSGSVPLAVAGTVVIAIRTGTGHLTALVSAVNDLYEQGLFVQDWKQACDRAEAEAIRGGTIKMTTPPDQIFVRNLWFTYPNNEQPALAGVDLTVRRGEIIALVGENGSGKTTLAKLMVGLYMPRSGAVWWDGHTTAEVDRASLYDHVALVAQDFVQWPFTARVNVTIGRSTRPPDSAALHASAAFGRADEVVDRLDAGWDTLLAPEFLGGTMLSGGQWQRIGLARAHYRNAAVVIFDEPTAALDPRAEIEVFDRVSDLARQGRAVVLVTHRLASVRRADRIYVLDRGKLIEQGTHDALMALNGRYAELYTLQASQHQAPASPA
ncbi:ABC transporter ATP-binding protein [Nonomuraea polychroma]|uniref:ABC transporter ATP-binding protein n=1 Tax=Nonomuraea polychroma TaxID=46176 RepID=UPI003D8D1FE3